MSSRAVKRNAQHKDRICLALDLNDESQILAAVDAFKEHVGYFKLNSAFTLFGPQLVQKILERGGKIFLDLKLHDIPNTLSGYGEAVVRLGVHIVTVHIAGGSEMLSEFVRSTKHVARQLQKARPKLIGITVLTSIGQSVMNAEVGIGGTVEDEVLRKARIAASAGLDGIVCSGGELDFIRPHLPQDFLLVTPGVRPEGSGKDDHQRVYTYAEAVGSGSGLLVVGRSVLNAKNTELALAEIYSALEAVNAGLR